MANVNFIGSYRASFFEYNWSRKIMVLYNYEIWQSLGFKPIIVNDNKTNTTLFVTVKEIVTVKTPPNTS